MTSYDSLLLIITWLAWMQIQTMAFSPLSFFTRIKAAPQQGDIFNLSRKSLPVYRYVLRSSQNNIDGFQNDNPDDEGKELAKQFYEQLKQREEASKNNINKSMRSDELENYEVKQNLSKSKNKKFTGRAGEIDSTGKPSAGLFAGGNGSVYASFPADGQGRTSGRNNNGRSAYASSGALSQRDKMMRDEINFMRVASSEATIIVQGILVLLLLGFTLYIGSTGGITDGSDRFGAFDGMINEFNGMGESIDFSAIVNDDASTVITADTVKEGSVWL